MLLDSYKSLGILEMLSTTSVYISKELDYTVILVTTSNEDTNHWHPFCIWWHCFTTLADCVFEQLHFAKVALHTIHA